MPPPLLTGSRIRDRRLAIGMKQADLAAQAGISASYLNLIEHNRRRIGGKLLVEIAATLETEPTMLSQGADSMMLEALQSIAEQGEGPAAETDRVEELVGRFPGWASKLTEQNARIEALEQTLRGLNDRLTHDPVLSEKMHEVLGAAAAIRSTSSILVETPNIDADWRARFHANIDTESRRLAETSAAMAAHFDRLTRDDAGFTSPLEAVSAFFEARGFHITEIEQQGAAAIEALAKAAPEISGSSARQMARIVMQLYAEDAAALPLEAFTASAAELNYDPAALAQRHGVDLQTVFRRLATLPRSPDAPEIGLVTCDAAGAILLRKPPSGFSLPRFGAACPLWPLFAAMRSPGMAVRQRVESSEGASFIAYSIAAPLAQNSFDAVPVIRAAMLLVATEDTTEVAAPLGPTCRVCPRRGCAARREPSILSRKP